MSSVDIIFLISVQTSTEDKVKIEFVKILAMYKNQQTNTEEIKMLSVICMPCNSQQML